MGKSGAVVPAVAVVAMVACGVRSATAEPGHRGPMFGAALMAAGGVDGGGAGGGELLLGWAHRQIAVGLWSRVSMESAGHLHLMTGMAGRWWSSSLERIYVEGRLGFDHMEIFDYEEPLDGPPGDGARLGGFAGAAVGLEVVRHPSVIPIDLRAGIDRVVLDDFDDRTFAWLAVGLTFY
jgi:hypothetical protein